MVHSLIAFASYDLAIYIFKMPVIEVEPFGKVIQTPYASLLIAAYLLIVLIISHFTYRWIEAPFRDRSKKWIQSLPKKAI